MVLRIFKVIAISGFLTAVECAKFAFGRGWELTALADPLAGLRSLLLRRERRRREMGRGRGEEGNGPLSQIPESAPAYITATIMCLHLTERKIQVAQKVSHCQMIKNRIKSH